MLTLVHCCAKFALRAKQGLIEPAASDHCLLKTMAEEQ